MPFHFTHIFPLHLPKIKLRVSIFMLLFSWLQPPLSKVSVLSTNYRGQLSFQRAELSVCQAQFNNASAKVQFPRLESGSVIKGTGCFSRGPSFSFQHPQPSITPVLADPGPFLASMHTQGQTEIHAGKTTTHKINQSFFYKPPFSFVCRPVLFRLEKLHRKHESMSCPPLGLLYIESSSSSLVP